MYLTDTSEHAQSPGPSGGAPVVLEGIVRKQCVAATYNRMQVILAPHVLFMKNDAPHVGAVTVERDGLVPKEPKLGVFKLDGLVGLRLDGRAFRTSNLYQAQDERFGGAALMAVEG